MPNFNKTYRERGTVLAIEREKLLKYSHWTELSRLPDAPENRTVITFSLDWTGDWSERRSPGHIAALREYMRQRRAKAAAEAGA
jgi:hypothetical protein